MPFIKADRCLIKITSAQEEENRFERYDYNSRIDTKFLTELTQLPSKDLLIPRS
jgi:hypothetical protein